MKMNFEELYSKKGNKCDKELSLILKFYLAKEKNARVKDLVYLFLCLGSDTKDDILLNVKSLFKRYSKTEKKEMFEIMISFSNSINVEALIECMYPVDYEVGEEFFLKLFQSPIDVIDKFLLYREILDVSITRNALQNYTDQVIEVSKQVLITPSSLKAEVRMSISILRQIYEEVDGYDFVHGVIGKLYEDNSIWAEYVEEEIIYRQSVLTNNFGEKVAKAFRNKDYLKVVKLIGKYENELPSSLAKKLEYSKKKMNISNN